MSRAYEWQTKAWDCYRKSDTADFLLTACPGAGKTRWALKAARDLIEEGKIKKIVIVVPTDHLKDQWIYAANELPGGRRISIAKDRLFPGRDYDGIVLTYAAVAAGTNAEELAEHCSIKRKPTLVIFDEIHHAGEDRRWAESCKEAFSAAALRMCLSGTPFRTDDRCIPFLTYEEVTGRDGRVSFKCVSDYSYSYGDALFDRVCRPVFFPTFNGEMTWQANNQTFIADFDETLSANQSRDRLRTALYPGGEWVALVMREMYNKLCELRRGSHHTAAALIIARDVEHADALARTAKELLGVDPVVVHSGISNAAQLLRDFKDSNEELLISVRMVSEGVDIPRLRCLFYATNYQTELSFRQAMGRICRTFNGDCFDAFFYFAALESLKEYALHVKEEREHSLAKVERGSRECRPVVAVASAAAKAPEDFSPLSSIGSGDDVIYDGSTMSREQYDELEEAKQYAEKHGMKDRPIEVVLEFIRDIRSKPQYEKETNLRRQRAELVAELATLRHPGENKPTSDEFKLVNVQLMRVGLGLNEKHGDVNIDRLERSVEMLEKWITNEKAGKNYA